MFVIDIPLAYMWMISSSSSQIQDHPSKLCQVQQHNHQPACAADELYWRNTTPHCAPTPTSLYKLINVSLSTYHLLPKIFSHGFSAALLPIFYSELHKGVTQWLMVGGSSLSLSLSLSLTHTHPVNFFSSYEWMNEWSQGKCHSFLQYPKWRVLTLEFSAYIY